MWKAPDDEADEVVAPAKVAAAPSTLGADIGAGLVGVGRSASLGLAKYPAAAILILSRAVTEGPGKLGWQDAVNQAQEHYDNLEVQSPTATTVGKVIGGVVGVPGLGVGSVAAKAATLPGRLVTGTSLGAGAGAVNAATTGGDVGEGALIGGVGNLVGEGVGAGVRLAYKMGKGYAGNLLKPKIADLLTQRANTEAEVIKQFGSQRELNAIDLDQLGMYIKNNPTSWTHDIPDKMAQRLALGEGTGFTRTYRPTGDTAGSREISLSSRPMQPDQALGVGGKNYFGPGTPYANRSELLVAQHATPEYQSSLLADVLKANPTQRMPKNMATIPSPNPIASPASVPTGMIGQVTGELGGSAGEMAWTGLKNAGKTFVNQSLQSLPTAAVMNVLAPGSGIMAGAVQAGVGAVREGAIRDLGRAAVLGTVGRMSKPVLNAALNTASVAPGAVTSFAAQSTKPTRTRLGELSDRIRGFNQDTGVFVAPAWQPPVDE